jgi:anti-sigma B factor antagonist
MPGELLDKDGPPVQVRDGRIRVFGELTIQHAEDLKPLLLAALPTDGSMAKLDLAQVSEVDTAGIQLLMAAHREASNRGASLQIVAVSQAVQDALELLRQTRLMKAPAERAHA